MNATQWAWAAVGATLLVRIGWMVFWLPPAGGALAGLAAALWPFLPLAAALAFRLNGPLIYAGIAMLVCFAHGVMEAVAMPTLRLAGLLETAATLVYFVALWRRSRAKA
jgi:uncharacterized membrane protein